MDDFVLASDIQTLNLTFCRYGLNIETDYRQSAEDTTWGSGSHLLYGGDRLVQFELVRRHSWRPKLAACDGPTAALSYISSN